MPDEQVRLWLLPELPAPGAALLAERPLADRRSQPRHALLWRLLFVAPIARVLPSFFSSVIRRVDLNRVAQLMYARRIAIEHNVRNVVPPQGPVRRRRDYTLNTIGRKR